MFPYIFSVLALLANLITVVGHVFPLSPAAAVRSVPVRQKVVALTFDDGPHPVYTRQLIDILHKYRVKATFFMVGAAMRKYPETVREVLAKGHAIGNHTFSHPPNLAACSGRRMRWEITACRAAILRLTGQKARGTDAIFRPPRGLHNQKVLDIARKEGYQTILWTVCGNNRLAPNPPLIARRVTARIAPGGIILLHDGSFDSRWKDVEATQLIVATLLKKGYRFVTVPQLLAMKKWSFLGVR